MRVRGSSHEVAAVSFIFQNMRCVHVVCAWASVQGLWWPSAPKLGGSGNDRPTEV